MPSVLFLLLALGATAKIDGHLSAEAFQRAFEEAFDAGDAERMAKLVADSPDRHFKLFNSYARAWIEGKQADAKREKLLARARALAEAVESALDAPRLVEMVGVLEGFDAEQMALWRTAQSELDRGLGLVLSSQYRAALEPLTAARKSFETLGWIPGAALAAFLRGEPRLALGLLPDAIEDLSAALQILEQLGSALEIGNALADRAGAYQMQGKFAESLADSERAVEVGEKIDNDIVLTGALVNCGRAELHLGRDESAAIHFERAVNLAERVKNNQVLAAGYSGLALVSTQRGDYQACIAHAKRALSALSKSDNPYLRGQSMFVLGQGQLFLGHYESAFSAFEQALALFEGLGHAQSIADVLDAIGVVHRCLGQQEEAISYHERAFVTHEKLGNQLLVAVSLNNLGVCYADLGQYEKAVSYHEQALHLKEGLGNPIRTASSLNNLAQCYHYLGRDREAIGLSERSSKIADEIGHVTMSAHSAATLGLCHASLGETDQAIAYFARASALWETLGNLPEHAKLLVELGEYYRAKGQHLLALETFEQFAADLERVNLRALGEDSRTSFLAQWSALPARVSQVALDLATRKEPRSLERAFPIVDQFFARRLLEGLQERSENVLASASPELAAEYTHTLDHMIELRVKLEQESAKGESATEMEGLRAELEKEQDHLASIERALRETNPRLGQLVAPKAAKLAEVQGALAADAAFLVFVLGTDASFVWVVTTKDASLIALPGEAAIKKPYDALAAALTSGASSLEFVAPARELYQQLLAPALAHCAGKKELLIVPDGFLGFLPFEVLLTKEVVKGDNDDVAKLPYLVRDWSVRYAPSGSFLTWLASAKRAKPTWKKDLLLLGDPLYASEKTSDSSDLMAMRAKGELGPDRWQRLKGTRDEVKAIAEPLVARSEADVLFQLRDLERSGQVAASRFDLCVGEEASVRRLKQDLRGYRILHLAVHGFFDTQYPWFSGLVLSETKDGAPAYANTLDLAMLQLDAEIVFLSACETAKGEAKRCEGIKSIARSFLLAGAHSVVATQWAVADLAAPVLATTFYEKLLGGLEPARALREAKLALIAERGLPRGARALAEDDAGKPRARFAHPSFWAGFVLWGR